MIGHVVLTAGQTVLDIGHIVAIPVPSMHTVVPWHLVGTVGHIVTSIAWHIVIPVLQNVHAEMLQSVD